MITCPCNVDPLTPHYFKVKLGFTGVYMIFLIFALKREPTIHVLSKSKKNITFFPPKIVIFTAFKIALSYRCAFDKSQFLLPFNSLHNQSRTNGPINAHLTIAQVMPKYNHNNEKQEALL